MTAEPVQYVDEQGRPLYVSGDSPLPVSILGADITIDNVTVSNEVEISNDTGNPIPVVAGLSIPKHDYIELSYTGSEVTGVTYKLGGTWNTGDNTYTGGTVVGQLELVYDGGNLVQVVEV